MAVNDNVIRDVWAYHRRKTSREDEITIEKVFGYVRLYRTRNDPKYSALFRSYIQINGMDRHFLINKEEWVLGGMSNCLGVWSRTQDDEKAINIFKSLYPNKKITWLRYQ